MAGVSSASHIQVLSTRCGSHCSMAGLTHAGNVNAGTILTRPPASLIAAIAADRILEW